MTQSEACAALLAQLDRLMQGSTAEYPLWNQENLRSGQPNRWNYIDGCMMQAMLALREATGKEEYLRFVDAFVGWFVQVEGSIRTYDAAEQNLDNIHMGTSLFPLYALTGKPKYRLAMDTLYRQLQSAPRTREGSFWHKKIYPNQVWLDGLYMAQPFYMGYETRYHGMRGCGDVFLQFKNVRRHMCDPKTGLYFHGYDESRAMPWADPQTGLSRSFWLRAMGWLYLALVDCLACMSEELYYEYRTLQSMLRELTDALAPWQDAGGMFWQVVDAPGEPGNYLETSGSAILAYGLLKAVRLGFLPERYRALGVRAFQGTADRSLMVEPDGNINLGGICLVAGLGGAAQRDGTHAYYYGEPVVRNEAKGLAPMLLATAELLRL
ncbi:MAG: glycoside hydrolase family 88 protein [Candidatus Limiplasma sp.]|nr:glycoside hydrolase family 88 protein [Candidatus Limiplasma sp.]